MKFSKTINFLIALALLSIYSCVKKVEIDIPYEGDKIVLFSSINQDSTIDATVKKSFKSGTNNTNPNPTNLPSNATVKLLENGVEVATFINLNASSTEFYSSTYKAKPNKTYTVKASAANLSDAYGTETMVSKPNYKVDSFYYVPANIGANGKSHNYIKINLTDNANEENFYFLKVYRADTNTTLIGPRYILNKNQEYYFYVNNLADNESPFDFIDPQGYSELYFTDAKFNGKNLNIKLDLQRNNNIPRIGVVLISISKSYYRYIISSENQQNNSGNPFAEPSQVYSNITNGYGLVATTADSVFFKRK